MIGAGVADALKRMVMVYPVLLTETCSQENSEYSSPHIRLPCWCHPAARIRPMQDVGLSARRAGFSEQRVELPRSSSVHGVDGLQIST